MKTTGQIVYDAIVDLHNQEQIVTRKVLCEVTGLKMTIIDDHVSRLCDEERIRRVENGVFVPSDVPPPARSISVTQIVGGLTRIEIGDECLDLWPREARALASLLAGFANQFAMIQAGNEIGQLVMQQQNTLKTVRRELAAVMAKVDPPPQLDLLASTHQD
ncbi:hypothetical protein PSQ40_04865 [Curvibacter sp. HBC61]|uniref:Transcriptional regulator n=1 Tax=Curvibacter cyanobacteriorum TaxID=3026422 RepID=A0ABT5MV22_9BURK|nr:hypothetical protein [Curvibacter sp. HBC61]MDD0837897.1 hypothetical protein [Curvibacter sp. HBC61]